MRGAGAMLVMTSTWTYATLEEHFQPRIYGGAESCGYDSWCGDGTCVSLWTRPSGGYPRWRWRGGAASASRTVL